MPGTPGDRKPDCGNKLVPAVGAERLNLDLLQWLPGETLFSLVSRLHRLWGHRLADQTADVLFGRRRQGYQHDFPSGLHEFEQNTAGLLGDVKAIALERTLLRFYRPFLSSAKVDEAIAAMAGPSVAHLKFRLGLLTSRFRAHHPLKACAACIAEDRTTYGWAWWHLDHQYPGFWVCLTHGERLLESATKTNGVARFQWQLPELDRPHAWLPWDAAPDRGAAEGLSRLARLVVELVDQRAVPHLDGDVLKRL
ncbi:TniQ family protein [Paucibacter sediminis]|uniref:TniQ family protein n=1 Tax=Paucibacter sediminis TaxID=3019553 RepID=A0AA95NK12_9BURK|nr:TniQ family protein [Paucibacter sp. S2-9]WIT14159.1 TniQ family protein [Paucibacter sp. S2-9]